MTHTDDSTGTATTAGGMAEQVTARRIRGLVLIVGAVVIAVLVQTEILAYFWFPLLTGLTYLAAAAAGRSRSTLWAPGFVLTTVGLALALWLRDARPVDSFQFLALSVMALGLGGVLAALFAQARGITVSAMSVSLAVLLFGGVLLIEQQEIQPLAGRAWAYASLLAVWGAYELRPSRR